MGTMLQITQQSPIVDARDCDPGTRVAQPIQSRFSSRATWAEEPAGVARRGRVKNQLMRTQNA